MILVSFCSSHLAIKNCYNVHFMKIEKIDAKIDLSAKNSKKFVYYNEELITNSKFQTQLSRKLQRFRTCRKNKKCSIFHDLSEYIIFHMIVTDWTGLLKGVQIEARSRKKFFSKLADFWYSVVFGHEKSIGASPEFRKNFHDPLSGAVVKTCNT